MGVMAASSSSLLRLFAIVSLLVCSIYSTGVTAQEGKPLGLGAVLAGEKNLTTFYNLIQKFPDLLLQLPSLNGITIVAPTNAAFERIPLTSLSAVWKPDDAAVVVPILQYHIVQGQFPAESMAPGAPVFAPTLLTSPRWTNLTQGGQLVRADKQPDGFVAPTTGSGSRSDLAVDNLLIPPTPLNETLAAYADLSFLGALHAAGLYDEFAQCGAAGNCTIFAPTVQAFRAVNSTLSTLGRDALRAVLRHHLVPGRVLTSPALLNGTVLNGDQQQPLRVRRAGNFLYVDAAQVVQQDVLFANGVLHFVDNVLNPAASANTTPDPTLGTQKPAFATDGADAAARTVTDAAAVASLAQPFTTALPCTASCPVPTTAADEASGPRSRSTSTATAHQTSSSKGYAARCTTVPVQPAAAAAANPA
ncbi:uncharacterized protein PG998_011836 [Apiospora kogelbergensis]|uniref:uncharacterized protein n=1 Tax=Apiospora kogelbergensis TaxID=1337665 RepID=UPI0031328A43